MELESSTKSTLEPTRPTSIEILAQLERILASTPFRTSKRCSDLLRHVVNAACESRLEFLKERTLGIAVFNRDPEYDTNQDPVVRNTAGQVRKRLALYYLEPGRDRELRIELPAGAYVPQIYHPAVRAETQPLPLKTVAAPAVRRSHPRLITTVIVAVLLVGAVALVLIRSRTPSNVDLFWAPMLKQPGPIVLCVGQGHTYKLKGDLDRLFEGEAESPEGLSGPTGTIPMSDLVPIWDRAIGINDAQTLVRLTALFAGFGHAVEFRGGRSTSLGDLRGRSTVLIGAFNNSWTLSLTGELRFYFDEDPVAKTYLVRDRLHPKQHAWQVRNDQPVSEDYEDYAIVSRVANPTTEQVVLVAAGIKGGGTAAAGEFLSNSAYLRQALQQAPSSWERRNVQFVLKTRLLRATAGPPEVIAAHYW
jgi:hypothetical protein